MLKTLKYDSTKVEVLIAPQAHQLLMLKDLTKDKITVASQNISLTGYGAFTGEISAESMKDIGINSTLVGHSERRHIYGEKEDEVGTKTKNALA